MWWNYEGYGYHINKKDKDYNNKCYEYCFDNCHSKKLRDSYILDTVLLVIIVLLIIIIGK